MLDKLPKMFQTPDTAGGDIGVAPQNCFLVESQ